MAIYKVLQDVEAEDKLVGPLTLRQFLYALVCLLFCYLCFLVIKQHVPYLVIGLAPPALILGFFAFPWGREQPTELWALARIRFLFKPRKRIWDQSGVSDYVTVTAPKRITMDYTNGLSETEVSSRLKALADVIDSHGWATKNVDPAQVMTAFATGANPTDSDRLVGINTLPEIPSPVDTQPSDDILDEQNSPVAKQFDQMLDQADTSHRERIMAEMNRARTQPAPAALQSVAAAGSLPTPPTMSVPSPQNDYWFTNQPQAPATSVQSQPPVISPVQPQASPSTATTTPAPEPETDEERALAQQLRAQAKSGDVNYAHMHTIQPMSHQPAQATAPTPAPTASAAKPATSAPVTRQPKPATLNYVNNDDLSIATIARQVNENPPDEVVISLH